MSRTIYFRVLALIGTFILAGTCAFAQQASKPPEQTPKPAKRQKKVWTEDDVHSVRKPWDQYKDQQAAEAAEAARAAAEATRAAAEAKEPPAQSAAEVPPADAAPVGATGIRLNVPDTVEGLRKQVEVYQRTIESYHQRVADCRSKYFATGDDDLRKELQLEIDFLNSEIEKFGADLNVFEAKLEERLTEGQNPPAASSAPTAPPSRPQPPAPPAPPSPRPQG